ncbi:hypothetical protein BHE74_00052132 [Ensete ventricosum]|nr:hypothetical protein BHE74_00052132 [Ensete ventricosum]
MAWWPSTSIVDKSRPARKGGGRPRTGPLQGRSATAKHLQGRPIVASAASKGCRLRPTHKGSAPIEASPMAKAALAGKGGACEHYAHKSCRLRAAMPVRPLRVAALASGATNPWAGRPLVACSTVVT